MIPLLGEWIAYAVFRIMWPLLGGWFILFYLIKTSELTASASAVRSSGIVTALLLVTGLAAITLATPAVFGWTPAMGPNTFLCLILALLIADGQILASKPILCQGLLLFGGFVQSITVGSLTVFLPALLVLSGCLWICLVRAAIWQVLCQVLSLLWRRRLFLLRRAADHSSSCRE